MEEHGEGIIGKGEEGRGLHNGDGGTRSEDVGNNVTARGTGGSGALEQKAEGVGGKTQISGITKEQEGAFLKKIAFWRNEGFREFAKMQYKVKDKDAKIVPMVLNTTQEILDDIINYLNANKKPVRLIIVKARQQGVSTYSQARQINQTCLRENYRSVVVSYDKDSASEIFRMFKRYYQNIDPLLAPKKLASNKQEIELETGSIASVATAGDENLGSGYTINFLHISELGKWKNGEKPFLAVSQAVPYRANTAILIESTACGVGNLLHSRWISAVNSLEKVNGDILETEDYIPVFIPWFIHDEYSTSFRSKEERDGFLDSLDFEERAHFKYLLENFPFWKGLNGRVYKGVTLEKLKWYSRHLKISCLGDKKLRAQEYPSTPEEAFISSANCVFDTEIIKKNIGRIRKEDKLKPRYEFFWEKTDKLLKKVYNVNGNWRMVQDAYQKEDTYLISADIAEGLEHGDNSCCDVVSLTRNEQVAQICTNRLDTDVFAEELIKASWYFNRAWVVVENNNHGLSVIKYMLRRGFPKLYKEISFENKSEKTKTEKYGFNTNSRTKPLMIDELVTVLREDSLKINFMETLNEMTTFVRDEHGKMGAEPGTKDDRVMSLAINAIMFHKIRPERKREKVEDNYCTKVIDRLTGGGIWKVGAWLDGS